MEKVEVIVIGGGISGFCVVKLFVFEYGINVIVLEVRNWVGGRINIIEYFKFKYVDLGGVYVGLIQNRILCVVKELGIQIYKVYNEGSIIEFLDGKR